MPRRKRVADGCLHWNEVVGIGDVWPWAMDGESYSTGSSALGSPADIKKGEKIYIYAHYADAGDVTVQGTLPDLPSEEQLAANDKSYFFYVIFE